MTDDPTVTTDEQPAQTPQEQLVECVFGESRRDYHEWYIEGSGPGQCCRHCGATKDADGNVARAQVTPADAAQVIPEPPKKNASIKFHGPDGTRKFRPGPKMRAAISEVLLRKQAGWGSGFKEVAEKHGVKYSSLETLVRRAKKGLIDLSDPLKPEQKKEIDLRAELERSLRLLGKYEKHLNDVFEKLLKKSEDEVKDGNLLAFDQLQIGKVVSQLQLTGSLRHKKEKGVLEVLGQLMEIQKRRERAELESQIPKPLNGRTIDPKQNQVTAAAIVHTGAIETIRTALAKPVEETPQQ